VKMWGSEDKKMWRCEDVKMWGCEDEKMRRWEDVKMRRWKDVLQTPTIGRTLRSYALGKKWRFSMVQPLKLGMFNEPTKTLDFLQSLRYFQNRSDITSEVPRCRLAAQARRWTHLGRRPEHRRSAAGGDREAQHGVRGGEGRKGIQSWYLEVSLVSSVNSLDSCTITYLTYHNI
jgi:hypothetical protein